MGRKELNQTKQTNNGLMNLLNECRKADKMLGFLTYMMHHLRETIYI